MNGREMVPAMPAGMTAKDEMGRELARSAEMGQDALAAQAEAMVVARMRLALGRPRNVDDAMLKLLNECRRPSFARVATYAKPVGGGKTATGLSIRFAEAAHKAWKNLDVDVIPLLDDPEKRVFQVVGFDLEANIAYRLPVIVEKWVERSSLKEGQIPISQRVNSYGKLVYRVEADEGSMLTKMKAEIAKAHRDVVLAMIPGDILDECRAQIRATCEDDDAKDPAEAKKRLLRAFDEYGVKPSDLEQYLGHSTEQVTKSEVEHLRGVYAALKTGEVRSWAEFVKENASEKDDGEAKTQGNAAAKTVRDKVEAKRAARRGAPTPEPPGSQPKTLDPKSPEGIGSAMNLDPKTVAAVLTISRELPNDADDGEIVAAIHKAGHTQIDVDKMQEIWGRADGSWVAK